MKMHLRWEQIVRLKLKMRRWKSNKLPRSDSEGIVRGVEGRNPKSYHEGLCLVAEDRKHLTLEYCQRAGLSEGDSPVIEDGLLTPTNLLAIFLIVIFISISIK